MDLCEESPRSVVGHVGDVFPRKRAAQDNIEEGRQRCDSKVLPVVAAPATQRGQFPVFPGHEEYLKNICSQSPANGNSMVRSYAGVSVPGYHDHVQMKQNQDRLIMFEDHATESFVCACLDGHGVNGHKVSHIFKREIEARLCSHPMFTANIEQAIHEVLAGIEFEMYRKEARLADYSGTTITLAVIRGRRVTVANIGDSRIIVGKRRRILHRQAHQQPADHFQHHHPLVIDAFPLSVDHKPHLPMEHARIVAAGGRVFSVRYEDGAVGPPRVWLGDANVPGLAMSRSLGDFVVHTAGVISRPDIFHYELHPEEDCYLIAATDGLWDYLQNQEVISLVHQAAEPHHAVTQLMHEVRQRWWKKERMLDDTTICVVQFQGSGNSRSSSTSSDGGRKSALDLLSPPTSCETSPVLTGSCRMSDI